MIDRAGHTSREKLLKVLKGKKDPLTQGLALSLPPPHSSSSYNSPNSAHSFRLEEQVGTESWFEQRNQNVLDAEGRAVGRCAKLHLPELVHGEGLMVNVSMVLSSNCAKVSPAFGIQP